MTTQTKALKEAHDLSLDGRDFAARQIILDVIANLEKEALAKPALMIYRGELCYKSQEYDQSFGMWCPVTQDLPFPEGTKFYTTPPQRTWVGLTAKEKHEFRYSHMTTADFIEEIEAKLKQKNGYTEEKNT